MPYPKSPRTLALEAADRAHLWHPFTQAAEWDEEEMLIVERAEGCWLVDTEGRRYLDGVSSLWVNVHGHRRAEIDRAIAEQLGRVAHSTLLGLASVPSIELARRLIELAPGRLSRVFYSDSGSTAVEVALKMAYQFFRQRGRPGDERRTRFVAFTDAYHGDTVGSVSLGGIDLFHGIYRPLLFDALRAPYPYCYRCPEGKRPESCAMSCLGRLGELLDRHGEEVCAVVIEPLVQGAAGIITAPDGFLAGVKELCRRHGVLLVCDEVATGFGRTGTFFACEQEGVEPDLLCLAKGISGGYLPLAATLVTEEVYEAFRGPYEAHRTFFHGHSYTGNPLACAAGLASLDVFASERLIEKLPARSARLQRRLAEEVEPLEPVGEVRQRGLMVGIELVADRATREAYPPALRLGRRVILAARERGVVIRPLGDVIVLMPPLAVSEEELDLLVRVTAESIRAAAESIG
ncbi:MAG: adenosylmethionine--8-amino-7-oxononanoate transaminase [Deltaproteobacteria bacterium]|nr:adenosylmethionine--8-amino-7-oxononanoate transaminase [Deltaproteobacteria bacterium]